MGRGRLVVTHRGGVRLRMCVSVSEHGGCPSSWHTTNEGEVEDEWMDRWWMEGRIEGVIQQVCHLLSSPPSHTNTCEVHYHSLHFTMTRMVKLLTETELCPALNLNGGKRGRMKRRRRRGVYQESRCPLDLYCSLSVWFWAWVSVQVLPADVYTQVWACELLFVVNYGLGGLCWGRGSLYVTTW